MPALLIAPSLKLPLLKVPPASVIVAVFLIWSLAPSKSVPPEFTVTDAVEPRAPAPPADSVSVPALTVVLPVNVFAPLKVTVPAVVLVNTPVPSRIAETVPLCRA